MSNSMKSDHLYAEMLQMMREQGKKDNPPTIQIGNMQSNNSVKIGDLVLNAEDLYIADYLIGNLLRNDLVAVQKLNNTKYIILARVVQA